MKLTDLTLIFIIIMLPMVVVVYVNTSFVIESEKEEMYYKTIINTAIEDATTVMKEVENTDLDIDYGYSGIVDNKISINSDVAIDTFYNSLFNNFGITGNESSENELKSYIPVLAVLDYDGIYIHSAEKDIATDDIVYVTKPKKYYSYTYAVRAYEVAGIKQYKIYSEEKFQPYATSELGNKIYQAVFTMDDYIILNVYDIQRPGSPTDSGYKQYKFYLEDSENNWALIEDLTTILSADEDKVKNMIVNELKAKRKEIITNTIQEELTSVVNEHNFFAKQLNIKYEFALDFSGDETWLERIDGIGMIAIIQGLPLGNRYLNYNAYSTSTLLLSKKYYLSNEILKYNSESATERDRSYLSKKLYHISDTCDIYKEYIFRWKDEHWEMTPKFYYKKAEAAKAGYSPCPVCKP